MSHKLVPLYIGDGEYYTRIDTDNVIAEKDAEIEKLDAIGKRNQIAAQTLRKKMVHQKYKRCLEIAALCFEKSYSTTLVKYDKESGYRLNFYDWWGKRWLELAKKFKPLTAR